MKKENIVVILSISITMESHVHTLNPVLELLSENGETAQERRLMRLQILCLRDTLEGDGFLQMKKSLVQIINHAQRSILLNHKYINLTPAIHRPTYMLCKDHYVPVVS